MDNWKLIGIFGLLYWTFLATANIFIVIPIDIVSFDVISLIMLSVITLVLLKTQTIYTTVMSLILGSIGSAVTTYYISMHNAEMTNILSIIHTTVSAFIAFVISQTVLVLTFYKTRNCKQIVSFAFTMLMAILYDTIAFYAVYSYNKAGSSEYWLLLCLNGITVKTVWSIVFGIPFLLLMDELGFMKYLRNSSRKKAERQPA